jgi:hypothetical protein
MPDWFACSVRKKALRKAASRGTRVGFGVVLITVGGFAKDKISAIAENS